MGPEQAQMIMQMVQSMSPEQLQAMMSAGGEGGAGAPQVVRLTAEESAAVERLMELGFTRQQCVEAYLACDKNEELAANFLFSNMDNQ